MGEGARDILFVCTANICRSPMAEDIFNALASDAGMPFEASSAGTAALVGEPIAIHAREALEELGVYADGHRARQVDERMVSEVGLVLAMNARHAETLRRLSPANAARVHVLPAYALGTPEHEGISDPYGQSMSAFRACARRLFECADGLVRRLRTDGPVSP